MAINMADILNTKKRDYQYNGPVESSDYNERVEENYKDLVYLYNKSNIIDNKLSNLIGVLNWDINSTEKKNTFNSFFEF